MNFKNAISVFSPQTRFERHTLAWAVFIFANAGLFTLGRPQGRFIEFLADYILSLPIIFFIAYLTIYLLIPKLLLQGKVLRFSLIFLVLLVFSGFMEHFKTQYILLPLISPEKTPMPGISFFSVFSGIFFILIPTIYCIIIKFAREWYNIKVLETEEERKQLRNELKYLKSQVHPHFLLVTLSNLETIARESPEKAAPGIEKISEILNFILYECNLPFISLNKEMAHVRRFIELQEMNFSRKPEIIYNVIGPTIEVSIAPLMIFTIVEFFFKKTDESPSKMMKISIFLEIYNKALTFSVDADNFNISDAAFNEDPGIQNLKKRMELIYQNKAELSFTHSDIKSVVQFNLNYA
jgi:LytS/YehU family sensor histidine kinase